MDSFLFYLSSIDLDAFHAINGWCGRNINLDHVVTRLESVQLKSLAFIGTFGALWFQRTKALDRRRETLILMFVAIILSLVVARTFANLLPFRLRPMFTADIGYRPPLYEIGAYFENWSSFPSDTAAIVFAMTTGFWLVSRWWGLLWAAFSIVAISARIYLGLHYPSDVLVGSLIGLSTMIATNHESLHARFAAPLLAFEQKAPAIFYGLLFPFMSEVSSLFPFSRGIYHAILHVALGTRG